MMGMKMDPMKTVRIILPVAVFLAIWEIVARSGWISRALFPPPSVVFVALLQWARSGDLSRDIGVSFLRVTAGLTVGALFGVALGLATGRVRHIATALSPIVQLFRPLPPVA